MKIKRLMALTLLVIPGYAFPSSAFELLDAQGVSRLDLAMLRLKQEVLEYKISEWMSTSKAIDLRYAGVRFDNETQNIKFFASAKAEPTRFYCRLALRSFMNYLNYGEDAENSAKIFYSSYFMPAASAPRSYEIQLYESVYLSTKFEVTIVDPESTPQLQCRYSGSSREISYSEL